MSINILLVDDHAILRQGLRMLLAEEKDFQVIGEAGNGLEALQMALELKPDVIVMDLMMPIMGGIEATRRIKVQLPETKVVILSMHAQEVYLIDAIQSGAIAYVVKESTADELVSAIRAAIANRRFLCKILNEMLVGNYFQKANQMPGPFDTLSPREQEVFKLVAEGLTSIEIAQKLELNVRTIEVHRSTILRKLNIKTQTEIVRLALKRGIISAE